MSETDNIDTPEIKQPKQEQEEQKEEQQQHNQVIISTKRGYLNKWQDRQVGFTWTISTSDKSNKHWTLRFVVLDGTGRLSYYKSHLDYAPRYVLDLKGCAVQDDGCKPTTNTNTSESSSFYHVFTIYHKPTKKKKYIPKSSNNINKEEEEEDDDELDITPLLRFSTENLAEKNQWMDVISDACAYRDSIHLRNNNNSNVGESLPVQLSPQPALPPPKATRGTLPPIYYSQPATKKKKYRRKSLQKSSSKSNLSHTSGYPPSRPMHKSSLPSYLSKDSEVRQSYRGFLNLALILLVISNFRLMIDTIQRHGSILSKLPFLFHYMIQMGGGGEVEVVLEHFPLLSGFVLVHFFIVYTFLIEYFLSSKQLRESLGMTLHVINCAFSLTVPILLVWSHQPHPFFGSLLLVQASITWMKIVSYVHANMDYRTSKQDSNAATLPLLKDLEETDSTISYPQNVTLKNIYYFWLAPSLTYQIAFPRTSHIRISFIISILLRIIFTSTIILYLVAQVIAPALDQIVQDLNNNSNHCDGTITSIYLAAEHLLTLAIANTYIWLLVFYTFFHLFLNLLAEMLRFGDRVFYKDWWNASEVASFWRLWNMPVHYWLVRHVYFPCIRVHIPKQIAGIIVFLVSAIFHEVLISIPFHKIHCWSFMGMMAQVPLSNFTLYLEKKYPGSSIGNVIFWTSFCVVGQPMAAALYTIDYWKQTHSFNSCSSYLVDDLLVVEQLDDAFATSLGSFI